MNYIRIRGTQFIGVAGIDDTSSCEPTTATGPGLFNAITCDMLASKVVFGFFPLLNRFNPFLFMMMVGIYKIKIYAADFFLNN